MLKDGNITVLDCIDSAENGWFVILNDGRIMGFTNGKGKNVKVSKMQMSL